MRVPVQKQVWWWTATAALVMLVLWALGDVMTPFLIGAGIAYVLDPLADRLERSGLSRTKSVALITLIAGLAFVLALVLVVPMVVRQLTQLVTNAPHYLDVAQSWLTGRFPELVPEGGTLRNAMTQVGAQLSDKGGTIMVTVLSSISNIVGVVLLAVIVPVVAFYLLLDWDRMVARLDTLLPREHAGTIRSIARQINESMAGFLRGQGLVTLILATFYSTALLLVGLPFALVIGISAAVLSIIPYVGVFTGGVTSVAVAAFTFWDDPKWIVAVLAIFVVGQILEGNYLQPKIIGGHVGLHPVWLMIALAVFGKLLGFVGLVVAVPLGAIIGVLVRFFIERYKESSLYTGRGLVPEPAPPLLIEVVGRGPPGLRPPTPPPWPRSRSRKPASPPARRPRKRRAATAPRWPSPASQWPHPARRGPPRRSAPNPRCAPGGARPPTAPTRMTRPARNAARPSRSAPRPGTRRPRPARPSIPAPWKKPSWRRAAPPRRRHRPQASCRTA